MGSLGSLALKGHLHSGRRTTPPCWGDTAQGVGRVSACRTCPCDGRGAGEVKPLDAAVQDDEAREPLPRPQGPPQQGLTTEGTLGAGTMGGAHDALACAATHPHKAPRSQMDVGKASPKRVLEVRCGRQGQALQRAWKQLINTCRKGSCEDPAGLRPRCSGACALQPHRWPCSRQVSAVALAPLPKTPLPAIARLVHCDPLCSARKLQVQAAAPSNTLQAQYC